MEGGGRPHRGRGSGGRRGGGGGSDSGFSGEHRGGRGRGSHHRGRGKRDHYRGRGRGTHAADFFGSRGQDVNDNADFEDEGRSVFSRRKLESNWDRYEASELEEQNKDVPVQRGTDYHALLGSAGDSFSQFRFSEEKDWEVDSLAAHQMAGVFVDLALLAQSLQELPLHQRLSLESELVQAATPAELPAVTMVSKPDTNKLGGVGFKATTPVPKSLVSGTGMSSPAKKTPVSAEAHISSSKLEARTEEADEELDLLLGLQKPVTELSLSESQPNNAAEEATPVGDQKAANKKETEEVVDRPKEEETAPQLVAGKQEVSEEDLEDWLDSMIS
ncbi:cell death regulator Aven [Alosa sapidissima]|uniref:cell death regulator Aven n=1 Tax=Alosa sapidissima TaxID=34773 RepID=UPI001C0804E5|nr:cell death regulator Aven [Alosa sapidissima]